MVPKSLQTLGVILLIIMITPLALYSFKSLKCMLNNHSLLSRLSLRLESQQGNERVSDLGLQTWDPER